MALLLTRIVVGALMLTHGLGKFYNLIGDEAIAFGDPIGIGVTASLVLTVFAEVFCSIFLIIGFSTRLAAIPLILTMLVAVLIVHASDEIGKKELPILYTLIYFILAVMGAGKYSLDHLIFGKITGQNTREV